MATRSSQLRMLVAAILALATLTILAAPASASTSYHYDNGLRGWVHAALESASYTQTHGKTIPQPVEVRCYADRYSFEMDAARRGWPRSKIRTLIAYWAGGNSINIRAGSCANATAFTQGVYTAQNVGAFTTLLHESLHRQGFRNEHLTEEFAIAAMRAAGQLTQYTKYVHGGAVDKDAAWRDAVPTGEKVLWTAFAQSNRVVADIYRTTWPEIQDALRIGWAKWLRL